MMKVNKSISYKLLIMIIIISLIFPSITVPSIAASSDYSLSNKTVSLDGENDGTVEVNLVTTAGGTFYALDANWTLSEKETTTYFTLSNLTAGGTATPMENDPTTGKTYWADSTFTGFDVSAGGSVWTATYTIDKDTPAGEYTIGLTIDAITGGTAGYDSDENINLTATITVEREDDVTPFTATFSGDSGVDSINVYYTQTATSPDEENVTTAYARDGSTGAILSDGNGQINFTVIPKTGYTASVVVSSGNYKNIKGPSDTGTENMYRITKVSSDLTITITTSQDPYTATFTTDSGVLGIDIYYTQDYETDSTVQADETNVSTAVARNGSTGLQDTTGSGQINFKVNLEDNYLIDSVTITGSYKNKKTPEDLGVENMYRITKITSDLTITVTTKERKSIVPEISGIETSYEYTGSSIKPEITVNIYGTTTTLTEGTDYTISYGTNTELGTGSVSISSIATSNYVFTDTSVNFNIVQKELTEDDITVPTSITYTGSSLTPSVVVTSNGETLVKDTDYTVTYSNQTGNVNEYITVTIEGIGNYKTTTPITKTVLITPKPSREIDSIDDLILSYGETKTYTDTADCEITYSSSNEDVITVTHSKSGTTSTNKLNAVGVGTSVITVTYAETSTYAETTITFTVTVNKASLTITGVTISNKEYDGTTSANVSSVAFNNSNLTIGTDYTWAATFDDANVGTNKSVSVIVTLIGDALNNYSLTSSTYNGTANITAVTITSDDITIDPTTYEYDGTAKEPTVTVEIDGTTLTKNTDYTIAYSNNVNVGTGKVTITGKGNYKTASPITKTFTITAKTITPTVADIADVTYNMEAQEPTLTVTAGTTTLIEGTDYNVTYSNNTNAGTNTATATISKVSGGNYTFTDVSKTFTIKPYTLTDSDVSLSYTTVRYDGTAKEPTVTVTLNGNTVASSNYGVSYSDNTEIGTAKVTITATGSNFNTTADPVTKTFTIADKEVLTISGITDNQSITYTGNKVELNGTLAVGTNDNNITVSDLTTTWYGEDGSIIEQPTDVGSYSVIYSYSDTDYVGSLAINFEITKASSGTPTEVTNGLTAIKGQTLADVSLSTTGLAWIDETTEVLSGNNSYSATYTQNNDTKNYTTETVSIKVYGKTYIDIKTSVNGTGGTISSSIEDVLEGTSKTITFTPSEGYEIDKVTINGTETSITNNTLTVTAETEDLKIVVYYKVIQYTITITANNAETNPSGIITVDYNSNQEITITANFGYKLTSVMVGKTEMISELNDGILTISNITSNQTITVTAEQITYNYLEGAGQTYTIDKNTTAIFRIDADYSLFSKIYVDGNLVDSSNYTTKSGSTIVTFTEDYMESLSEGTHTLKVAFTDGGEATTTFTIASANSSNSELDTSGSSSNSTSTETSNNTSNSDSSTATTTLPKTGDEILKYVAIATISMLGILAIVVRKIKKYRDF